MAISITLASLLALLIATVTIYLQRNRSTNQKLPPGSLGWPLIGETLAFQREKPENFIKRRMSKYSPGIFKTNIYGENTVVMCGQRGNKFLFTNELKLFTAFRPHSMQKILQFQIHTNPKLGREEETKVLQAPAFLKPEALVGYVSSMHVITRQHLSEHWGNNCELKVFPLAKTLALTLACKFFMGVTDPQRISKLVTLFDGITESLHSLFVPSTAKRSAALIRQEMKLIINEKRAAMAGGARAHDILSLMITANESTEEAMARITGLLVAGYSTVASVITFFMKFVGERPEVYNKVVNEHMGIWEGKEEGEHLIWEDYQKMKYSWNVVNEVMRLVPPLQGTFREAINEFTYQGYVIPKGWKVLWCVSTTNKDCKFFPEPEKFEPSRYERQEGLPPYVLTPFGGGPRTCPGKEYGRLAILTFVHNVVKRFKWEVISCGETIGGDMMPYPSKGLPIRLYSFEECRQNTK